MAKGALWCLDVSCKSTQGIAQWEATIIGQKHFGSFESGLGIGAKVMDDVPKLEPMLEAVRSQDVLDHFGSKAMAGTAPKCSQPELCVGVHRWTFQKTLLRVKKLANEWVFQTRLPFLN